MALKALLATLAGLSADVAKEYTKRDDGSFVLAVEAVDGFALEDVRGLKSAHAKTTEELNALKVTTKAFEGLDPTKAKDALEKVEKMKDWKPEDKVREQIEAKVKEVREKLEGDLKQRDDRLKKVTSAAEKAMIEQNATDAIVRLKGLPGSPLALLPHVKARTRIKETDSGEFKVEVLDQAGNVMTTAKSNYKDPATIDDLVEEFKKHEALSRLFEGSGASGGGSSGSKGGRSGTGNFRLSAADAKDPAKYRAAKAEADKAGAALEIDEPIDVGSGAGAGLGG